MGLEKYRKKFMEEKVNGFLLLELDDYALENDLEMSTKIHRIKMMAIINGRHPISNFI